MRTTQYLMATLLCVAAPVALPAAEARATGQTLASITTLEEQARARVTVEPRISLLPPASPVFKNIAPLLPSDTDRVPNYVRAVAMLPDGPVGLAGVMKAFLFEGTVEPETKLAMALRMAQVNGSPYTAAHVVRLLRATDRGQVLLTALKSGRLDSLSAADQRAIEYSDALTKEVHGLSDLEFQKVRALYNDSQIVELTLVACLFNYFTRFTEALNLPVEQWALEAPPVSDSKWQRAPARVALVSDAEIALIDEWTDAARKTRGFLGAGVLANSLRAMVKAPALASAFRKYFFVKMDQAVVNREVKLQVSFAVSMANGCRYCALHQVLGLRKLGVDPAKLVAMKKDDEALTSGEHTAVLFGRKLTREPAGINDADYAALRKEFGEQGALEVLQWTCNFAFMNRFTDGLRLPSEDAAVQVYLETYGSDPYGDFKAQSR